MESDDWRLMGQERYLLGKQLRLRPWASERVDWDHDHCEFCMAKIWDQPGEKEYAVAYVTLPDGEHWICPPCVEDFRQRFGWCVVTD